MKMREEAKNRLEELIERYPQLGEIRGDIEEAYETLKNCFDAGGKLMLAGNGGSYADTEHIAGELMKGFYKKRPIPEKLQDDLKRLDPVRGGELADRLQSALPTIVLAGNQGIDSAFANDVDAVYIFAQQLLGYGKKGDVFLAISTSGNSRNILYAAVAAKAAGITTVALTGKNGGELKKLADVSIVVPADKAHTIQELHLPVYHALCLMLEDTYFEV